MSHALDLVEWSGGNQTMEEFVNSIRFSLPVLAVTTSGYAGCDEYIHEVSTNEICWIYGIQRQERIVGKSSHNEYLSIPVDYDTKFEVVGQKNKGSVTARDLLNILKETGEPFNAKFDGDQRVRYQVGASSNSVAKFGEFEINDSYEEKFLLTYTISGGAIFPNTVPIPVYIPITMDVAAGFKYGDKCQYQSWCNEVKNITSKFLSTPAQSRELIIFSHKPTSGVYEYLIPTAFVSKDTKKQDKYETISERVNDNHYILPQKPNSASNTGGQAPARPEKPSVRNDTGRYGHHEHQQQTHPLPPMPRRAVPPIPVDVVSLNPAPRSCSVKQHPPAVPVKNAMNSQKSVTSKSSSPPRTTNQVTSSTNCSLTRYHNISDVPENIDIKQLTKADVSHILHLMKLDQYRVFFEDNDVDGQLLVRLSETDLISELGLEKIPARRLSMFVHEGWRPK